MRAMNDTARWPRGARGRGGDWGGGGGGGCRGVLTVVAGGSGVSRPRAVAGERAPGLRAAAAVLTQAGEAPEGTNSSPMIRLTGNI